MYYDFLKFLYDTLYYVFTVGNYPMDRSKTQILALLAVVSLFLARVWLHTFTK